MHPLRRTLRLASLAVAVAILAGSPLQAQSTNATLRGRVTDSDGEAVPGVPVTVSTRSHGIARRTVVTDMQGRFKFQLLPPASDYFLNVDYPGFAATEIGPIDLDPGRTTIQNITMRSSEELTERVEISAQGNVVDTTTTKSSTSFNTEYIEGLPIIGRNYLEILTLTPGVTDTDGDGNPNVQGARETGLQYRLDGGNITDPVSGKFGQNLNLDAIEEIEVITAGASAEYGRADGGFANIITKSGGNDFEGTFRLVWRGRLLDGDGAGENNDTFVGAPTPLFDINRFSPYITLGGPLKQDRLWYFISYQHIEDEIPLNLAGLTIEETDKGRNAFVKLTWQVTSDNKLALQYNDDPREVTGLFLDFGTLPESDAMLETGGRTWQVRWTSIIGPDFLMEALLTNYESGVAVTPVSDLFHRIDVTANPVSIFDRSLVAVYPWEACSTDGTIGGFIPNCDPSLGPTSIYQIDFYDGITTGPFSLKTDDTRTRKSIKADLTWARESEWGEHQIKAGLEFADEKYSDEPVRNPILFDQTLPCTLKNDCLVSKDAAPQPPWVTGFQTLQVYDPVTLLKEVEGFNSSGYVTDTWRPRPNLTLQFGARIDNEDIDSSGFSYFDPREERREYIAIIDTLCAEAHRVFKEGGQSNWSRTCNPKRGFIPGSPPVQANLEFTLDNKTPRKIREFDRNRDGVFDSGVDGNVWEEPLTTFPDRRSQDFTIDNLNISPRVSFAWDPWADGRTKLFGTWGRYYDRLFLDTVDDEMGPDVVNYTFFPDPILLQIQPDEKSEPTDTVSIFQVDRDLKTPYTDVFTLGLERAVGVEWTARLTYTQRMAWNLLQDTDMNHALCTQYDELFGIRPSAICPGYTDPYTGKVVLDDDIFGTPSAGGSQMPNGAPDLYNVNRNFNQVLRVGNFNSSRYRSVVLELNRRLHRNWQMQASYTYSRAQGQAEDFLSNLGDDPSTRDDEEGFLDYDQRHRAVLLLVSHLPADVELGGKITWESGTPFSVTSLVADSDNTGNVTLRTFFPTGQRNDQRNGTFWVIDGRVVKRFVVGRVSASAELSVQNLLNMDDATISEYHPLAGGDQASGISGVQLEEGPRGLRRFGRIWELGLSLNF